MDVIETIIQGKTARIYKCKNRYYVEFGSGKHYKNECLQKQFVVDKCKMFRSLKWSANQTSRWLDENISLITNFKNNRKMKKWIKGFDPSTCKYIPVLDEPMFDQPMFETKKECKKYCDACNKESNRAWKKIKHKLSLETKNT